MSTENIEEKLILSGLTAEEVEQSRREHGANLLSPPPRTSMWKLYLEKYNDPIVKILLVAAVVSLVFAFIQGEFIETIGIFLAIFLATTVGFIFERDAARKFDVLNALGEEEPVKVKRDGKVMEIPRHDIVVGDILIIEVGDEIPADGILLKSTDLQINESSLTGEPIVTKTHDLSQSKGEDAYPANFIMRSTMVMNGRGVACVSTVGDETEIGKVARMSTEVLNVKTPLNIQLEKLARLISKVGTVIAVAAFVIFLIHNILTNSLWHTTDYMGMAQVVLKYFMMSVTLIVMAVPEGLPMTVTLSLALNMRRMLKSNNLVRKLHACETMGAVTVICTDKTGTLTQNKMQVGDMVIEDDDDKDTLYSAIALNTTAYLDETGIMGIGNPTEVALLLWLGTQGVDYSTLRDNEALEAQLPFSTERKYMATIGKVDGKRYLFVKGAPEIVGKMCALTDEKRNEIKAKLFSYQSKAMRTLAFACHELGDEQVDFSASPLVFSGLTIQAMTAISDPLRGDVPAAVAECVAAGIKVKIVTGDTSATATEIARQIGIWDDGNTGLDHITGAEFAALSYEEAYERVERLRVISRARPSDKQRLVEMLQKRGEVVAVTGDGTNDAPALHHAQVGLSLGSGTSVAKEASDMTLLDDSFGSIARAVMWGRSLYRNIQRFLFFQLVINVTALLIVLAGSIMGTSMPLTVIQILWVNLIMDTFAAMALASLSPSHEVMKDKPRKQSDFIISHHMGSSIITYGVVFFVVMFGVLMYFKYDPIITFSHGASLISLPAVRGVTLHELTIFFTFFVMLQFWNLLNAKTFGSTHSAFHKIFRDNGMLLVLLIILIGQWVIVTFGGEMFRTEPLSLGEWLVIIGVTSIVLWVGEIHRAIQRSLGKR